MILYKDCADQLSVTNIMISPAVVVFLPKIVLDLEGFYQTNFAERSNDFCRIPISLMKPSKSNTI